MKTPCLLTGLIHTPCLGRPFTALTDLFCWSRDSPVRVRRARLTLVETSFGWVIVNSHSHSHWSVWTFFRGAHFSMLHLPKDRFLWEHLVPALREIQQQSLCCSITCSFGFCRRASRTTFRLQDRRKSNDSRETSRSTQRLLMNVENTRVILCKSGNVVVHRRQWWRAPRSPGRLELNLHHFRNLLEELLCTVPGSCTRTRLYFSFLFLASLRGKCWCFKTRLRCRSFEPLALSVLSSLTKFYALVGVPRFFVLVTSSSSSFVGSVSARDVFCEACSSTPGCGAADFSCPPCRIPPAWRILFEKRVMTPALESARQGFRLCEGDLISASVRLFKSPYSGVPPMVLLLFSPHMFEEIRVSWTLSTETRHGTREDMYFGRKLFAHTFVQQSTRPPFTEFPT